jgi:hypothetical protein
MYCWPCKTNMKLVITEGESESSAQWHCASCGRTSRKGIGRCADPDCGCIGVTEEYRTSAGDTPILLPVDESTIEPLAVQCTECVNCVFCKKLLKSPYYVCVRQDIGRCATLDGKRAGTFWHRYYAHKACADSNR